MKWKLALVTLALFSNSFADPRTWDLDGVSVRQAYDLRWQGQSARADDGSVMIVWTDARNGHHELFGQLWSPTGEPQWGDAGRFLARSEGKGIYWPVITYSDDGWVVLWQDDDSYQTEIVIEIRGRMKAMKFALNGQPMWNDPEHTGIEIYDEQTNSLQEDASWVAPDGTGGAYVCWINEDDFFAQRITSDGLIDWETPIQFDHMYVGWTYAVGSDGVQNLVLAWSSYGEQIGITCKMIGPDGGDVWESPEQVCQVPDYVSDINMVADGEGGVVVVWLDPRQGAGFDIFAQRVSATGETEWQANGEPVVVNDEYKFELEVTASIDEEQIDGVLVEWDQQSPVNSRNLGFVQKIDLSGEVLWGDGGNQFCEVLTPNTNQDMISVVSDRIGGAVCGWREVENVWASGYFRIERWGADGLPAWDICAAEVIVGARLSAPQVAVNGSGSIVSVWKESYRLEGLMFGGLHSRADGGALLPNRGLDELVDGYALISETFGLPDGRVVVAWNDFRRIGQMAYFQILDQNGIPQYAHDGIKLIEPAHPEEPATVDVSFCDDGSGGFFAAVLDLDNLDRTVRATRWNVDGTQVGPVEGTTLTPPTLQAYDGVIAVSDSSSGAYVVFTSYDELSVVGVYATRIGGDCQPLWEEAVRVSANPQVDEYLGGAVPSNDGSCIVVWGTSAAQVNSYHATKLLANGSLGWTIEATPPELSASHLQVSSDLLGGVALTWTYDSPTSDLDVYVQRINSDGELVWETGGVPVAVTEYREYNPSICVDDQGNTVVAWRLASAQAEYDLIAQKISPTGELMWRERGVLIGQGSSISSSIGVIALNYENIYFTWSGSVDFNGLRVYVSRVNSNGELAGDPYWQFTGTELCDQGRSQANPKIAATGDGSVVIAWKEARAAYYATSVYAQRIFDPIPTAVVEQPPLPTEFSLQQNYPNPFNPETVIEFALPTSSKATIKVFDVTGREVATLIDEPLTAGVHRVNFNAQNLASGVYFYALEANEHTMTKKMVLLK